MTTEHATSLFECSQEHYEQLVSESSELVRMHTIEFDLEFRASTIEEKSRTFEPAGR